MTATLEVGEFKETVVVTGSAQLVQAQNAVVSTTLQVQQLQQLPLASHTALDSILSLPGVNTPYGQSSRSSTINGLPAETINITLDGINAQDNRIRWDGFFMLIRPMLDSVEEITVSTSTSGAESTGMGAVQVRMVTRSGSNRFTGSAYNTWRNQAGVTSDDAVARTKKRKWIWRLNTPYWFNVRDQPKTPAGDWYINDMRLQTPGFRVGGPVKKDKLFYFFNYEMFNWPYQSNRLRYLLNTSAQVGNFTYPATDGSGNKTVNLISILQTDPRTKNLPGTTIDPTIAKLLADIRQATGTTGSVSPYDLETDVYSYIPSSAQLRQFPTGRMDYNLTSSQRVSGTFRYLMFRDDTNYESRFPGFPNFGTQNSDRYSWTIASRSTIGKNVVNEVNVGQTNITGKGSGFYLNVTSAMFNCQGPGCQSLNNQPYSFGFPAIGGAGITGATATTSPSADGVAFFNLDDTLTWLKGKHTITMGASYSRISWRYWSQTVAKSIGLGLSANDPAYTVLGAASGNYPGGLPTTNYEAWARNLGALLTGRVTSITGNAYLGLDGKYAFNGPVSARAYGDDIGMFISDSWRVRPNLTLTAGLRYELQLPVMSDSIFTKPQTWQMVYGITGAGSGLYGSGNLYQNPRPMTGTDPLVVLYDNSKGAYETDWNNLAPSVGVAWRPTLKLSWLTKILGADPVFRGGYSLSYTRLGINFFYANYSYNPGLARLANRSETTGTPTLGYDGWPVLMATESRLFPSSFPDSPTYPITAAVNEGLDIHYPNWPVPHTHSYSAGFQRELGKSMALEIRYVGNTNVGGWYTWNMDAYSAYPMIENGFLDEFRKAQANLHANIVAGRGGTTSCRGCTFAYMGPGTGTSPLPIFMAYLRGIPLNDARNQDAAQYASVAQFSNSTWYNRLNMFSPSLTGMVGTGSGTTTLNYGVGSNGKTGFDANRAAAGLPANFFAPNPAIAQGWAYLETTAGNTRFNSLTIELRRRMSSGLLVQGNYTFQFGQLAWGQNSLRENWFYMPSSMTPVHSIKGNWVYELPFGQGKRFGSGAGRWKEILIGGWEFDGVLRLQSGSKYNYGGYKLVGMTAKDLQKMFKFYHRLDAAGKDQIYMFPQDVIDNSILALYTTTATTASGYHGALPTGRYFAPASSLDCLQYTATRTGSGNGNGYCPGTQETLYIHGPWFFRADMSFVKRITVRKSMRIEARMDLFNIFNTINFIPRTGMGSSYTSWQVTAAASDVYASQDPGGRITSFGLRFLF